MALCFCNRDFQAHLSGTFAMFSQWGISRGYSPNKIKRMGKYVVRFGKHFK